MIGFEFSSPESRWLEELEHPQATTRGFAALRLADLACERHEFARAIKLLQTAAHEGHVVVAPRAAFALGQVFSVELGDAHKAQLAYRLASDLSTPENVPDVVCNIAARWAVEGRTTDAISAYRGVMRAAESSSVSEPGDASVAAYRLGHLLSEIGDSLGAEEAWRWAISTGDEAAAPHAAIALAELLGGNPDRARDVDSLLIWTMRANHPACSPEAGYKLACRCRKAGLDTRALELYQQVVACGQPEFAVDAQCAIDELLDARVSSYQSQVLEEHYGAAFPSARGTRRRMAVAAVGFGSSTAASRTQSIIPRSAAGQLRARDELPAKRWTRRSLPGRCAIAWLDVKTRRSARREGASRRPLEQLYAGGLGKTVPAYQLLVGSKLRDCWLEALAVIAGAFFHEANGELQTLEHTRGELVEALKVARERVTHVPKIKLDLWTQVAIVLATVLGMITTWGFIQGLEWPLPVAFLASLSLAAFEVAIAGLFGLSVHALVKDEPDNQFALTVKERRLFLSSAVVTGLVSAVAVVVLAKVRGGYGSHQVVWLLLSLGLVVFSAYGGAALYDNKFEQEVKRIEGDLSKVLGKINALQNAFRAKGRSTMATGRSLCGVAAQIHHRGERAFVKSWRRRHRRADAVVPSLPAFEVPSDGELREQLLVPMYEFGELVAGEIVAFSSPRRHGAGLAGPPVPPGNAQGRSS